MTYIGGVGNFAGPIIGAILVTYLQVSLSDMTDAWQLYFGLLFIGMVMFAPDGIAGLLARSSRCCSGGQFHRVLPYYALALAPGLVALAGLSMVDRDELSAYRQRSGRPANVVCPYTAQRGVAAAVDASRRCC